MKLVWSRGHDFSHGKKSNDMLNEHQHKPDAA